jgi:hypothetical protein
MEAAGAEDVDGVILPSYLGSADKEEKAQRPIQGST